MRAPRTYKTSGTSTAPRLALVATAVLCLLVLPIGAAGAAGSSGEPKATASASVKKQVKKLKKQIRKLNTAIEEVSKQPGPQGPQGERGEKGEKGDPGPQGPPGSSNGWALDGNAGTNPASQFLGTTDSQALSLRVNGARALRLEPASDGTNQSPNVVGGIADNQVMAGVHSATIAGGGRTNPNIAETANRVTDNGAVVGGGGNNQVGDGAGTLFDARFATVAGGDTNDALAIWATVGGGHLNDASAQGATVAGGDTNAVTDNFGAIGGGDQNQAGDAAGTTGDRTAATVGGGRLNIASGIESGVAAGRENEASGSGAVVAGGRRNVASTTEGTIGGGNDNVASGVGQATVAGGDNNTASATSAAVGGGDQNEASGEFSTVAGGFTNVANQNTAAVGGGFENLASGPQAAVPGGRQNVAAGFVSFAAGRRAKANHQGAFVWGDSQDADMASSASNQFIVRAAPGLFLTANSTLPEDQGFINTSAGANPDGTDGAFLSDGGAWTDVSDEDEKEGFAAVEPGEVLDKVAELPVRSWSYKADPGVRHLGPVAQDFHRAFGLGADDRHLASLDANGVALAAIKGLNNTVEKQERYIAQLESRISALERDGR